MVMHISLPNLYGKLLTGCGIKRIFLRRNYGIGNPAVRAPINRTMENQGYLCSSERGLCLLSFVGPFISFYIILYFYLYTVVGIESHGCGAEAARRRFLLPRRTPRKGICGNKLKRYAPSIYLLLRFSNFLFGPTIMNAINIDKEREKR